MKSFLGPALLTGALLFPSAASAEFLVTPFLGKTFSAQQQLVLVGDVDHQTWIAGASAGWLSRSIIGAEVDFGYAPRFFKSDPLLNLVRSGSNVLSLTGNVLLTLPLSVTRDSLRPYATAGMGVLHAGVDDRAGANTLDRNLFGVSIGGGVIGFLNERAGVRFDVRHMSSTSTGQDPATLLTEPRLSFWRATFGVAIRY